MPNSKINFPTLPTFPATLQCGSINYHSKTAKFSCKSCDFYTSKSCNYIEHLKTKKHKITIITNPVNGGNLTNQAPPEASQVPESRKIYPCKNCNRPYFSKKGLWQHSKKCHVSSCSQNTTSLNNLHTSDKTPVEIMTSVMLEMFKTNHEQMMQMIGEVLTTVKPNINNTIVPESSGNPNSLTNNNVSVNGSMTNTNNSNNKTFNINMFLNEQCKDAMNMTEFVKTIQLDTDDMEDVGKHGFVKGISNIFITNLEKTEVTKRPIHCSDIKREVLYIKDDDKWERDNINSAKLSNAVRVVEQKNINMINQWAKEHPECENSNTHANRVYMTLSKHALDGDDDNMTKVVKKIAQNVIIDKNDYAS
jgi:hypothetical protein